MMLERVGDPLTPRRDPGRIYVGGNGGFAAASIDNFRLFDALDTPLAATADSAGA